MCGVIDSLVSRFSRVVMAGDFNFPGMNWLNVRATADSADERFLRHLITEHSLSQIVTQSTRERAIFDLVFLSDTLRADDVEHLPPIAGSDHDAQLWYVTLPALQRRRNLRRHVDYAKLNCALSLIDWTVAFKGCAVTDDYAARFTNLVLDAVNKFSAFVPLFRRLRLPKQIVMLLRVKKRAWTSHLHTRDMSAFKAASRTARAALRQHRHCEEMRLICSQDHHRLFKYINCKTVAGTKSIHICKNDVALTDQEAAEVLLQTFSSNFSIRHTAKPSSTSTHTQSLTDFACPIVEALHRCPNSNSCPDGLSFKLIKAVAKSIIAPLTIIFQHSLFEGIFPSVWKEAVVIPLHKGKGPKNSPHSYRPSSLCQCFGKILERVVQTQLTSYINDNELLCNKQHGFTVGRSTLTNLLNCDAAIVDIILAGHSYDLLSFDFMKTFDKVPHIEVHNAVSALNIGGKALEWLDSFLANRTFRVRIGDSISASANVTSGVIQGTSLGPIFYAIFIDGLLRAIRLPSQGYADDFKFIVDVNVYTRADVQNEINTIAGWTDEHGTPLSVDTCSVLHSGPLQPNHEYHNNSTRISSVNSVRELGVKRTTDNKYSEHCNDVIAKANSTCSTLRCIFKSSHRSLLWPAFVSYVLPVLSQCSSVWNPYLKSDVAALASVHRNFTRRIRGLEQLSYNVRLAALSALTLEKGGTLQT